MNVDKRPRPSANYVTDAVYIVIDDTDEEEPPRKRQKSVTPARSNGSSETTNAKPTSNSGRTLRSTPPPPPNNISNRGSSTVEHSVRKKASPWKHRPLWQKQDLGPWTLPGGDANRAQNYPPVRDVKHSTPNEWTSHDDTRLRGLSLSRERTIVLRNFTTYSSKDASPGKASDDVEQDEVEQFINPFKMVQTPSLRFNPSGVSSVQTTANSSKPAVNIQQHRTSEVKMKPEPGSSLASLDNKAGAKPIVAIPPRITPNVMLPPRSVSHTSSFIKSSSLIPDRALQRTNISVNVPLSDQAQLKQGRRALQEKLKLDVEYARQHPGEVDRILGLTGFSKQFTIAPDETALRAAQVKQRTVNRGQVRLELASFQPSSTASGNELFVHPRDQVKSILTARFSEQVAPPLTFCNTINDRRLNGKFQFISKYILRRGVKTTGSLGQPGCTCSGLCNTTCECLRKTITMDKTKHDKLKLDHSKVLPQYWRRPDGLVVLRDDFIKRYTIRADSVQDRGAPRVEISECGEYCPCNASCINQVVQRGRTVPLEIFQTQHCGFGVRSSANLVRGQFIELYLGEVITENELERREEAAEAGSTSYIYSLDWFSSHQPYHVDGENFGSAMRFMNHSCDPNAGTFTVLNNESTRQLYHLAFFAIQDIPAGTEITIDYTPQAAGTTYELNTADEGMERCYCSAKNCRQMLWLPGKERKASKKVIGRSFD